MRSKQSKAVTTKYQWIFLSLRSCANGLDTKVNAIVARARSDGRLA